MNDITTTFLKRLKGIALSKNERLQIRERLAAYSDMHPVPAAGQPSPFFPKLVSSRYFSLYAFGLLVVVVLGGGVTLAADASVPGDSLYAIKIEVNEPVLTALTPTPAGQARVAAELATRRIDEAVTLASRGQLTPERQAYLTQEFDTHAKKAAKKADELASSGNTSGSETVRANFAANLAGEAQALGAVTAKDSTQSRDLLRVVVATSETISGGQPDSTSAVPDEETGPAAAVATATSTAPGTPVLMTAKTAVGKAASTTPGAGLSRHVYLKASTSLRNRFASSTLNTANIPNPKTDSALPQITLPQNTKGDGTSIIGL